MSVRTVPPGEAEAGVGAPPRTMPRDGHAGPRLCRRGSPDGHWGQLPPAILGDWLRGRPRRTSMWTRPLGAGEAVALWPQTRLRDVRVLRDMLLRRSGAERRGSGVPPPWPRPRDGSSDRRPARTVAGVCRLGGAAGRRGGAAAAIVAPHGWPRRYVASDKRRGGGAEACCRIRRTAAEISTRSRPPVRKEGPTEESDGGGRQAGGQEEDGG